MNTRLLIGFGILFIAGLIAFIGVTAAPQDQTIEITYIANEGVLLSSGGKQVLIDGLHREFEQRFAFLPSAEREKIETAKAPFDKIDLILVSHWHLDHFHPDSVGLHLLNNPKAQLISSQQVVDEIEKKFKHYEVIKPRITGATPAPTDRVAMKVAGIDFEILRLSHGPGEFAKIQNLGHIVKLGGKKLLHVGDSVSTIDNFEHFNLAQEQIDIAILPFWFLTRAQGQSIVREHIKPKQIIAVHILTDNSEATIAEVKQAFPDAIAFTKMLEKRTY